MDPYIGRMFWTDAGDTPKIETAWMDGERRQILVKDRLQYPTGLTVDQAMDNTIFWVDTKLNTIESVRYDGSNRKIIIRTGVLLE